MSAIRIRGCSRKVNQETLGGILVGADARKCASSPVAVVDLRDAHAVTIPQADDHFVTSVDLLYNVSEVPRTVGYIAVCHAISDIYAVLGEPLWANVAIGLDNRASGGRGVLEGVVAALDDNGASLAGGHTVHTTDPFVSVSVVGKAGPSLRQEATHGDRLVLSKPLGTGIGLTALAMGLVEEHELSDEFTSMRTSNRTASRLLKEIEDANPGSVRDVTDVSGFGLLAAIRDTVPAGNVSVVLDRLPVFPSTRRYAGLGAWPPLADDNLATARSFTSFRGPFREGMTDQLIAADPQTSGGLLAVVSSAVEEDLHRNAAVAGVRLWEVGNLIDDPKTPCITITQSERPKA
jgi:selenide, water dikinase